MKMENSGGKRKAPAGRAGAFRDGGKGYFTGGRSAVSILWKVGPL